MKLSKKEESKHWLTAPYDPMMSDPSISRAMLIYLLHIVAPSFLLGFIAAFIATGQNVNVANLGIGVSMLSQIVILIFYKPIFKEWPHEILSTPTKNDIKIALKSYAILLLGNVLISIIPSQIPENQAMLEEAMSNGNMLLFGLFTVVFAPVIEELLFRHVFFRVFGSRVKKASALPFIANVIIFTLLHTGLNFSNNPVAILQYGWLSSVFAYTYAKTRSVEAPLILHVINNGVAFTALLIVQSIS